MVAALVMAGVPVYYNQVRTGPTPKFHNHDALLTTLAEYGFSTEAWAGFVVALDLVAAVAYLALAALLFWRRPTDRMVLLFGLVLVLITGGGFSPVE